MSAGAGMGLSTVVRKLDGDLGSKSGECDTHPFGGQNDGQAKLQELPKHVLRLRVTTSKSCSS